MAGILREEIRWADLDPVKGKEPAGLRPVAILSWAVFNTRSGTVIAMAIASHAQHAGFPLTLELHLKDQPKSSWVKISRNRTLSTERTGKKIGTISPEDLDQSIEGLNEIIGSYASRGGRIP